MSTKNIMKNLQNKQFKVIRVSEGSGGFEFELDNGDIYPIPFDLDYIPSVKEFQEMLDDSKELMLELLKKTNG